MDQDNKIIVDNQYGVFLETTYRIIKDNDFYVYDDDDNEISENHTKPDEGWILQKEGECIEDALMLESKGLFYQYTIVDSYDGVYTLKDRNKKFIGAELWSRYSNYLVPKKNQKYFFEYKEFDYDIGITSNQKNVIMSEWKCYFDKNKNLTVDKDLINRIKKDVGRKEGHRKPENLARIHPETIIQKYDYHDSY